MAELLEIDAEDPQQALHDLGWTDGLPVVVPTPQRVGAMIDGGGRDGDELLGTVAQRGISVTVEQAAVNAVLAGCAPEYFPVVLAAVEAMLDPAFNANTALSSTGGAAICVIVSGAIADEIGMNAGHNVLGSGNRANLTIGRALRLVARNVLDAKSGRLDGSSVGHPGKISLCFAEDEPPAPWEPLRVSLGFLPEDTTVTVLATEGPRQVGNHLSDDADSVLRTLAAAMSSPATYCVGKGGQAVIVLGPEHALALREAGIDRRAAQRRLERDSRVAPQTVLDAGVRLERGSQHELDVDEDGLLPAVPTPDDVLLVTAGGEGAGWSAYLPVWAPKMHSRAVTRRVRPAGEALPDCGPDGCAVSFPPIQGA